MYYKLTGKGREGKASRYRRSLFKIPSWGGLAGVRIPAPHRNEGPSCRPFTPPALPFMRIKGSKTRRGDPGPLSVGRNGYARKIFLRGFHTSSERFFRCRGCPRGAARSPLFKITPPKQRGSFEGAQSANADRTDFDCAASSSAPLKCAFREHNAVGQGFLSHKNPCAGVGARAPTNQFQDGILLGC